MEVQHRGLVHMVVAMARGGQRWPEVVEGGRRVWWQWVQRRERVGIELQRRGEEEGFAKLEP